MLSQFNFQGTRQNLDQVRPVLGAYLPGEVRQFILPVQRVVVPAMRVPSPPPSP